MIILSKKGTKPVYCQSMRLNLVPAAQTRCLGQQGKLTRGRPRARLGLLFALPTTRLNIAVCDGGVISCKSYEILPNQQL